MAAKSDPEFLKSSLLFRKTEDKINELAEHAEVSSYYKDEKYLQFPVSRYQRSGEQEWWDSLEGFLQVEEEIFLTLKRPRKTNQLRRDTEANIITIRHYVAMSKLRERFESYAIPYAQKYKDSDMKFHELLGSLAIGKEMMFTSAAKQTIVEKITKICVVILEAADCLEKMWMHSIVVEPETQGPLWCELVGDREPIHLYISEKETKELQKTAFQLARLCQEASVAGIIDDMNVVNDCDMLHEMLAAERNHPTTKLFPKLDLNVFSVAGLAAPEGLDEEMLAVQSDPWTIVPVNPALSGSVSTNSLDMREAAVDMYPVYEKLQKIVSVYGDKTESKILKSLEPLLWHDTQKWRYRFDKYTPELADRIKNIIQFIDEQGDKSVFSKLRNAAVGRLADDSKRQAETATTIQHIQNQLERGRQAEKESQFLSYVNELKQRHEQKTGMFSSREPPKSVYNFKSKGTENPDKKRMVDEWVRTPHLKKSHRKPPGDPGGSSSSSSSSSSCSESDNESVVSRAATIRSSENRIDRILPWAEAKVRYGRNQIKQNLGRNPLNTLKNDIGKACSKTEKFWLQFEIPRLDELHQILQGLLRQIDVKLDQIDEKLLLQKKAPIINISKWDSNPASYLKWSRSTLRRLENSFTDAETAAASIEQYVTGPEKSNVQKILYNCCSPKEAFEKLDQEYGNPLICLPKLREELSKLPDTPTDLKVEAENIQSILNYVSTAVLHGMEHQVSGMFIQEFRNKLSVSRREKLVDDNVLDCHEFTKRLERYKISSLSIANTTTKKKTKLFNNQNMSGGGDGRYQKKQYKCNICSEKHMVFKCPLILHEDDSVKIIEALKGKKVCLLCLGKAGPEHKCPRRIEKFVCKSHKQQRIICKCGLKKATGDEADSTNPTISNNQATINCVGLGKCGFPTEVVTLRSGKNSILVLLTYDSWSSHCMIHTSAAKELGLTPADMGNMDVSCHVGIVEEASRKVRASINGKESCFKLDFLLTDTQQAMPSYSYKVPSKWVKQHGIDPNPSSPSGYNRVSIGQDAIELFPKEIATANGVKLYKSRITGNFLLSGRAIDSETAEPQPLFNNRAMYDLHQEISTDSINISPVAKCIKCTSCMDCRKPHKPNREKQAAHAEVVKSCLTLKDEADGTQRYVASYPHNNLLPSLPVYEEEVKGMMRKLETRLIKLNLADQFNQVVADFIRRGVITVGPQDLENFQKSFVPLCYSLKADPLATTKLRICTNGSYKTGHGVSYNDTLISAPEYLNDITGILSRWRAAGSVAIGDIATCYHQIHSAPLERSLRRIWIKPVLGMGSDEEYQEACINTISFGESLGGPVAQFAIFDTAVSCMSKQVAADIEENAFMDDLQTLSYETGSITPLVSEVDEALKKRNLAVKEWVVSGSETKKEVKYLNYGWETLSDSIYLRPRINWSRKRRGAREAPDVTTKEQLIDHIQKYPITKRNLASIVMGTLYDPLGLGQPYNNNLKSLFREVCRMELDWTDPIPQETQGKLLEALEFFLTLNQVMFPRRAMFLESKLIEFCLYFDGSPTEHCGVSVLVRNVFHDGTELCRLLLTKARLGGSDILTAPRAELLACLMSTRLYLLIKDYLSSFLAVFRGKVVFSINGDSSICLAQIQHDSWKFRMWTATRVEEIKMNTKDTDYELNFYFVPSNRNFSDYLTRTYWKSPKEYEEFLNSLCIPKERQPAEQEKGKSLHDLDVKNIYVQSKQVEAGLDGLIQLPQEPVNAELDTGGLSLPQWSKMQKFVMYHLFHHQKQVDEAKQRADRPHVIKTLLERKSSYLKVQNTIAFMLKWRKEYKEENFLSLQDHAEVLIFQLYQGEATEYISNFKGNGFYTTSDNNGIISVIGRKTFAAPSGVTLRLVPPHNLLYKRITETYHQKFHGMQASPVFIRAQIQRAGYYVPSLLKRLKSLQDRCPLCRRYRKKLMENSMGTVQKKRLTQSAPFVNLQADLFGPMKCRSFINQRTTRKMWGLILICDFSRFISIVPVESLSAKHLMNAVKHHTLRFGQFLRIEVDLGTNFVGAKDDIEAEAVSESEASELAREIRKTGADMIQRSAKSPFLQGSAEHSVKIIKKILPTKHTMTLAEWFLSFNMAMDLVNKRPIGISNTMESFSPQSIIPVWSGIETPITMRGCTDIIKSYKEEFYGNWEKFYLNTVIQQGKWFEDSPHAPLQLDDVVLITDLIGSTGYMTMGRITGTTKDSSDKIHYYKITYRKNDSTKDRCVTRTARSLVFIFRRNEQDVGEEHSADIIGKADLEDTVVLKQKKKVVVKLADGAAAIVDK